ncbi:MAG: PQQ-binding-like beta-propeller repeat protein [Verrucomicrobiota bacterium]
MKSPLALSIASLLLWTSFASAEDWPQWRGPQFNGSTSEKGLPSAFTLEKDVLWSIPMAGPSASTPIVLGDKVFFSSVDRDNQTLHANCIDRLTGKSIWQSKVGDGYKRDDKSNYSSPSPVTDGKVVVFFYGNGDLAAFDLSGKELWKRNIEQEYGEFAMQWTFSASPLLFDGRLYLPILQRDQPVHNRGKEGGESYILCIDPTSGKTLWRHVRQTEAQSESRESFATPMPFEVGGKMQILILGGDMVSGHDPVTGNELWRWGTWNPTRIGHWRLVPSPIAGAGVVLACAPKKSPVYAVKPGSGVLDEKALAWTSTDRAVTSDVPTPAFAEGDFFVLSDVAKAISRVAPDGTVKWTTETPGKIKYEASPLVADGKIYIVNFNGEVVVLNSGDGKIVHQTTFGTAEDKQVRSMIVASHGQLFLRTDTRLFCVGKAK